MKLFLTQADLNIPYPAFLKRAGYIYITDRKTGHSSFVRPFGNNNYPRFHIYVNEEADKFIFNAHLDQKQVSYEGVSAHSGEYDSPLVKQELERIKSLISKVSPTSFRTRPKNDDTNDDNQDSRARRFSNIFKNN